MGKLARSTMTKVPRGTSPIKTISTEPDTITYNGGAGFSRDVKSELFLLAVQNFVGEQTFYEKADQRDARFLTLMHQATAEDPQWTANFLYWLRGEGNMRSASIVGAVEYGRALKVRDHGGLEKRPGAVASPTARQVLDKVIQRADEPGEALGYWLATYGRPLPKWFKRGLGDAADRLYTPYNTFKYDGTGQPIRFGDVVQMTEAKTAQNRFKWQLDRKFGRAEGDYGIEMLQWRQKLDAVPVGERSAYLRHPDTLSPESFQKAGMTWESLSGWLQGPMDAMAWETIIPSMGYMALLRNLRNFDEAGVSDRVAQRVIAKLTDPEQVARSRQLPMRFLSAYRAAPSDRWKHPLAVAMDLSLVNVPKLGGKTLVLADMSTSMDAGFSKDGTLHRWDAAALFGIAFARAQGDTEVVAYSSTARYWGESDNPNPTPFVLRKGANVLSEVQRWRDEGYFLGGGTNTGGAVRAMFTLGGYSRILLLTDEQADRDQHTGRNVFEQVPTKVPCYTFNLAGYQAAHAPSSLTRITIGGLSDKAFTMMKVIETRARGRWPWEA